MSEPLDLTEAIDATKAWALRDLNGYRTHWIDDEDITDIIQAAAPVIERAVRHAAAEKLWQHAEASTDDTYRRHMRAAVRMVEPPLTTDDARDALAGLLSGMAGRARDGKTTTTEEGEHRMKPSIGRVVHYVSYGTPGGEYQSQCRAAIVTAVHEPPEEAPWLEPVSLAVLNPEGMFFNQRCLHDEAVLDSGQHGTGDTWHWPERVE